MSEARYPNKYILSMNAVPYWMVWIQWIGGFLDGISGAYQATKNGVPIFCGIVSNGQIVVFINYFTYETMVIVPNRYNISCQMNSF